MATREAVANIEDLLPLSPMQEGMLYHSLSSDHLDIYLHQVLFTLEGQFEQPQFELSLQKLVERHLAFRSGFLWRQGDKPVQLVLRHVKLPVEYLDWREVDQTETRRKELLQRERVVHMDLARPPLLRLCIIRISDQVTELLWNMHHILMDGWSLALIMAELMSCYRDLVQGGVPILPPVQPYRRYIGWLEKRLPAMAEEYWRSALAGFTAPTPLMASRAPSMRGTPRIEYRQRERIIPTQLTSTLTSLAQTGRVTLNTVFQGAWALLLSRYSGTADIVFGATSSGRPPELPGIESMVGNFMNTLPVRTRVDRRERLIPWLASIQSSHAAGRQFEYTHLVDIQRWSDVPAGSPLFESIVVFENYPIDRRLIEGHGPLRISHIEVVDQTNYPLTLVAGPGTSIRCRLLYDCGRFSADDADQMLGHLVNLLESFAANAEAELGTFSVLSQRERTRYTEEWNCTTREFRREDRITDLFERAAARFADSVAITCRQGQWTYAELNAHANRVARLMMAAGIRRGDMVAVLMDRSPEAVAGFLGIMKAGAAYVPIEPFFPDARISQILSRLQVRCVLVGRSNLDRLTGVSDPCYLKHVVTFDESGGQKTPFTIHDCAELKIFSSENPANPAASDDLAYVIFTSGSTGQPKGVMVRHRPVVNLIEWVNREFNVTASDRILFVTSFCFDLSVYDMFGILAAGASIRIAAEDEIRDPDRLLAILRSESITFWDSAPAAIRQVVPALETYGSTRGSRLRLVFLSGDWIPVTLPQILMGAFPNVEVISLGGATEATVWSNYYAIGEVLSEWSSIPYGRPIQNARYYILDSDVEPQSPGLPGDLWIGGECLSDGYFRDPGQTARSFLPDPFADVPGARMYRTGDLARFMPDANIEFLGRKDKQVKIRGFRIELAEIESALARHPGVADVVVDTWGDDRADRRLVAYIVPGEQYCLTRRILQMENAKRLEHRQCFDLPDGSTVVNRNRKETEFSYGEIFEQSSYLRNGVHLPHGACVFDVGANIGLFAIQILRTEPEATVFAFEPLAPVFESLSMNAELYGGGRIKPFCCALGSIEGQAEITYYPGVTIQSGFYADPESDRQLVKDALNQASRGDSSGEDLDALLDTWMAAETRTVEVRTLSQVMSQENIERVDLLKVNVEKSELEVLAGIAEKDWTKIRQMVVETHSDEIHDKVLATLRGKGYHVISERQRSISASPLQRIYARCEHDGVGVRDEVVADETAPMGPLQRSLSSEPKWLGPTATIAELRTHLHSQLPEYMTPAHFVLMPELPVSPTGKIDRKSLPGPDSRNSAQNYIAPQDDVAVALAVIWSDLLGVERVGANDSFFELGGDSILSIQAAARAKRLGLAITPRDLFEKPTIAGLAQLARSTRQPQTTASRSVGEIPLTPIQRWWFEQPLSNRGPFTQSLLIDLGKNTSAKSWSATIHALLDHHDILRARFSQDDSGVWKCVVPEIETACCFSEIDIEFLPDTLRADALTRLLRDAGQMCLYRGPLFRAILIRNRPVDDLLLVAHHLVTDPVSWRLLLDDIHQAQNQILTNKPVSLGAKTSSFRAWAEYLQTFSTSEHVRAQRSYWQHVESLRRPLPKRTSEESRRCEINAILEGDKTSQLLRKANSAYNTRVEELLLAALAPVLARWLGDSKIVIDMEGHGRENIGDGLDVSRTVGWFTTLFPFVLENQGDVRLTIIGVKEGLRAVPDKGAGYGLFTEMAGKSSNTGRGIVFNYLGHLIQQPVDSQWIRLSPNPGAGNPRARITAHLLAIACLVANGQLQMRWDFDDQLLQHAECQALCDAFLASLRAVIDHCCSPEAGEITPADVASFEFSASEVNEITSAIQQKMTG